jgi:anaphase-promoting complex subunit 6
MACRNGHYSEASNLFRQALQLVPAGQLTAAWEPTLVNLAHALRKQRQYKAAVQLYEHALGLCPLQAGTHAALAYTHHLQGNTEVAVHHYHKALGLRPDDSFSGEMLGQALQQECVRFSGELEALAPVIG